jgi:transposase, IS30 family
MIGKGNHQAIANLTERKSRLALLRKVDRRTAELVGDAVIELLRPITRCLHTITRDNSKEFVEHERNAHVLGADLLFAHLYATWEHGANENMNGLIRQFIPKKRNIISVSND